MIAMEFLSAAEAGRLMRRGDFSPVDYVETLLARIAALDPTYHAFVAVTAERAREAARRATRAWHSARSNPPPM